LGRENRASENRNSQTGAGCITAALSVIYTPVYSLPHQVAYFHFDDPSELSRVDLSYTI